VIEQTYTFGLSNIDTTNLISYTCPNGTAMSSKLTPTQILPNAKACFEADVAKYGFAFYDQNAAFKPGNYLYRDATASTSNTQPPVGFLKNVQTDIYGNTPGLIEYWFPTAMPFGTNYLFNVYLKNVYNTDSSINNSTYAIQNQQ